MCIFLCLLKRCSRDLIRCRFFEFKLSSKNFVKTFKIAKFNAALYKLRNSMLLGVRMFVVNAALVARLEFVVTCGAVEGPSSFAKQIFNQGRDVLC